MVISKIVVLFCFFTYTKLLRSNHCQDYSAKYEVFLKLVQMSKNEIVISKVVKKILFKEIVRENLPYNCKFLLRCSLYPTRTTYLLISFVYIYFRITLTAQCDMDLRMFPLDTQQCYLIIESCTYPVVKFALYFSSLAFLIS